ncbi:MAG TPA: SpoIIE family protein phosphatase [bacterium]|jgi:sigma-B regulation protein RsbU (phosphoserine phosphatase)|nr:SpoIIE family protein phosphatase [bacterium]MDX9804535.1 SpoIIE family protein phosphatase [bacterium]HNW15608.1 SpoIIE family protein phosphatase [bacterium]HNZ52726.1 SpoIIE family protein phosphatase [bacterium]HOB71019.1 SpoIIE family protein phosphatase [bacterium]
MQNNITIVVVDDALQCRKHLEKILTDEGYSVILAENGMELEAILKKNNPSLILLDIIMPGMNGFEVMEQVISANCPMGVPVIFLTGNDDNMSKIKAFDLGAVDYIVKPFNPAEVRARVNVHLRNAIQTNAIIQSQAYKLRQITEARESILVKPEDLPEAAFSVYHSAVLEAGGDFYDVLNTSGKRFVYFLADLSGHDIAASYMVPAIKALIKQNSLPIYSVDETLSMMNRVLLEIMGEEKYLTGFYLVVDRSLGKISWSGAAHPPAVLVPVNGEPEFLKSEGDLIGMFREAKYHSSERKVSKGDRIVIFTDGLLENGESSPVWTHRKDEILKKVSSVSESSLNNMAYELFRKFIPEGTKLQDDVIVLVTEI